tara:strand:+ start:1454 stop:1771 length:318 start_codon:yes stop_codon:yes gene_type:complete
MSLTLITILSVAFITFMTRYLFLEEKLPLRLGPNITQLLSFSGPAVLTAIFIPILFFNNNSIDISISNAYLWGGVGAITTAYKTKNVYWTIACGGILFIGVGIYF